MTVYRHENGQPIARCDQPGCKATFGPFDLLLSLFQRKLSMANWETSQNRKVNYCPKHRRHKPNNLGGLR